jgi:hypothetical protein
VNSLKSRILGVFFAILLAGPEALVLAATHPDSGVATTYTLSSDLTSVSWVTCGSLPNASGCFQAGTLLGVFGAVGALLESSPVTKGNAITRHIYVLDTASGITKDVVLLHDFKRVDTVLTTGISTAISPERTVYLPLVGGAGARASMAAGGAYLYAGTNLSRNFFQIKKSSLVATSNAGPGSDNVTAITANSYGWVTVTQGSNSGQPSFIVIGPNGSSQEIGGGAQFLLDTMNAVIPADLPLFP